MPLAPCDAITIATLVHLQAVMFHLILIIVTQ